ncbi:integrase, partial [Enterobacter hormaechei]
MILGVTFRRRQHEISKVDRTVFSDVGVASENG